MAKHSITQTPVHHSIISRDSSFLTPKISAKLQNAKCRCGGWKLATFDVKRCQLSSVASLSHRASTCLFVVMQRIVSVSRQQWSLFYRLDTFLSCIQRYRSTAENSSTDPNQRQFNDWPHSFSSTTKLVHPLHCLSAAVPTRTCIHRVSTKCPNFGLLQLWHMWMDFDTFGRNVTHKVSNQKTLYYATSNNLCFCATW